MYVYVALPETTTADIADTAAVVKLRQQYSSTLLLNSEKRKSQHPMGKKDRL